MSYSTGLMETRASWTLGCDYWKTWFGAKIGFACISDTGIGDARIMLFSLRGTANLLKLAYASPGYGSMTVVTAGGALVQSLNRIYYLSAMTYHFIENTNLTVLYFIYSTSYMNRFILGKSGAIYKTFVSGDMVYLNYLHSTAGTKVALNTDSYLLWTSFKTVGNKQLILPLYPMSDSFTQIEETPMTNTYTFGNIDMVAENSIVSIGGVEYLVSFSFNGNNKMLYKTSD